MAPARRPRHNSKRPIGSGLDRQKHVPERCAPQGALRPLHDRDLPPHVSAKCEPALLGGHLWPQTYFTRDCDVVLRYESLASDLNALTKRVGCAVKAPANFVKPPGWGSARGDLAPSLSYEVLAKAKVIYREDYLLYERLKRAS